MNKINVIDLFSGCGGLTEGFLQLDNYHTLAAVDWELSTVTTLKKRLATKWNYKKDNVLYFDIQKTNDLLSGYKTPEYGKSKGLIEIVGRKNVDLIVGGPPCQAYSMAGRVQDKNGMQDDYRNFLFESYITIVNHFKPTSFVFENVEGILSAKPGGISIIERIKSSFKNIGYDIVNNLKEMALFDTSYYGVPQKRKRVIIYGVKHSQTSIEQVNKFYTLMNENKNISPEIANTYFDNLPKILPDDSTSKSSHQVDQNSNISISNHKPRFHNSRDIEIFKLLTKDIEDLKFKYISSKALVQLYFEKTGKKSNFHKYHVIRKDKPSNTIPAHLQKDGLRHIHPDSEQARSITVREAARLQTFDDDFEFLGTMGEQYKMIGNAVPPKFANIIASVILELNHVTQAKRRK